MRRMRQGVHQHQHDVQAQEGGAPEREAAQVHRVYDVIQHGAVLDETSSSNA